MVFPANKHPGTFDFPQMDNCSIIWSLLFTFNTSYKVTYIYKVIIKKEKRKYYFYDSLDTKLLTGQNTKD